MINNDLGFDDYVDPDEEYAGYTRRFANKPARPKKQKNKKGQPPPQEITEWVEGGDQDHIFVPTYIKNFDPKHFEYDWIQKNLTPFYQDQWITDVLGVVKAGKEANVYTCVGSDVVDNQLIAAKIYRPRMFRNLRNNAIYKQGRLTRDRDGKEIRGSRVGRAMAGKTSYGKQVDFATWIVHEYNIHRSLYEAGAAVPRPYAHQGNTILMDYVGDESGAARTLIDVGIDRKEALSLFQKIVDNIELMLSMNLVHGDLSAYNILYWEGDVWIIDFPQVVDVRKNPHGFKLFERDVKRVCEYFDQHGVRADAAEIAATYWQDWLDGRL